MLFSKYFLKLCYLAKIMITHDGTPSLKPNTYKLKVGGVSLRYGIEQIREGLHPKRAIPSKEEVCPSTKTLLQYKQALTIYLVQGRGME